MLHFALLESLFRIIINENPVLVLSNLTTLLLEGIFLASGGTK